MSDDCISRQAALDAIDRWCMGEGDEGIYTIVEKLPSVTPQPKTGHWYRVSMDKYVQHAMAYYRCSECGKDIIGEHNYCPNCGAKMVEPQERKRGMKCMECKHFERAKDGMRGGINGSCKLRNTSSYRDTRYGNQTACKTYFEPQERNDKK